MKKIEMGKKYKAFKQGTAYLVLTGTLRFVDGKKEGRSVLWESDAGDIYLFDAYGENDYFQLIEITPYADIPIDAPGWARDAFGNWLPSYFAGVNESGKPMCWDSGRTSFSAGGDKVTWHEFTTTKPEGV